MLSTDVSATGKQDKSLALRAEGEILQKVFMEYECAAFDYVLHGSLLNK